MPYSYITVALIILLSLLCIYLIGRIGNMKAKYRELEDSYGTISHADSKLKRQLDDITAEKAVLKNDLDESRDKLKKMQQFYNSYYNAPDLAEENAALIAALSEWNALAFAEQSILKDESVVKALIREYSFDQSGQKLEAAERHADYLARHGEAVRACNQDAEVRPGAVACLLDAFNGYAYQRISRINATSNTYERLKVEIQRAWLLVNTRGRSALNIVITRNYLEAVLDVLRWSAAVAEFRRIARAEKLAQKQEEEDERDLREAEQRARREEELFRKALEQARSEYLASATPGEKKRLEDRIADLEMKIKTAHEAGMRARSMAEMTREGFVYIISNIGSFGDGVFKIGMTRRLDPNERIAELGVASVPFPFDVHAFIHASDAPALEKDLHDYFAQSKVNLCAEFGREFYRVGLDDIQHYVERRGFSAHWTIEPEARQYRLSEQKRLELSNEPKQAERQNNTYPETISTNRQQIDTDIQSVGELIASLNKMSIPYVDKRSNGGRLWIESTPGNDMFVSSLHSAALSFVRAAHTRNFDGRPGWFVCER